MLMKYKITLYLFHFFSHMTIENMKLSIVKIKI